MASSDLCGFAALNEETSSRPPNTPAKQRDESDREETVQDEDEDEEMEDEQTLQEEAHYLYNVGLRQFGNKNHLQAASSFRRMLASPYVMHKKFRTGQLSARLRFNGLKYLGYTLGDHLKKHTEAADKLKEALVLDQQDVNLAYKLAVSCVRSQPIRLADARWALQSALLLSPNHWPALDLLVSVTHKMGDLIFCLCLIEKALQRDPKYKKGIVLGNAILKERPGFRELCPSLTINEKVLENCKVQVYPNVEVCERPENSGFGAVKKTVNVQAKDWESFLQSLITAQKESEDSDRIPPTCVELKYEEPAKKLPKVIFPQDSETNPILPQNESSSQSVEVSVQNVVQEMVDVVSGIANKICEGIVDDIVGDAVCNSSKTVVSCVLDEVLDAVLERGVVPAPSAAASGSKRPSNRAAAFVQEVPQDLLEKRRSTRTKGGGGFSDVSDERLEEVTVQSLLESFIPQSLLDPSREKTSKKVVGKASAASKNEEKKDEECFPGEKEQLKDVKDFIEASSKTLHSMRTFEELFDDVLQRLLELKRFCWSKELKVSFLRMYNVWRRGFQLPSEFSRQDTIDSRWYLEAMQVSGEIYAELVREGDDPDKMSDLASFLEDLAPFLEDDFLHLRLLSARMSRSQQLRVFLLHHSYYKAVDEAQKAILFGQMAMTLAEQQDAAEPLTFPESWKITATKFDKQELANGLQSLKSCKSAEGIDELFESGEYGKVVEILSKSLEPLQAGADEEAYESWLEKTFMLVESLWNTRDYSQCLDRCASALNRLCVMVKPSEVVNVLKTVDCCLQMLDEEGSTAEMLSQETSKLLCQAIVPIIVAQINGTFTVKTTLPWLLFYHIIRAEELRDPTSSSSLYPPSVEFLMSAHDHLGQQSLCTEDSGRLLLLLVETLSPLSRLSSLDNSDALKRRLDQALYCLYSHPSKKSRARNCVDHGASALALKWDKCSVLMTVVAPKKLPEFDDFKSLSITADTEALLKRFVALVPDSFNMAERSKKLEEYLNNRKEQQFPKFKDSEQLPENLQDLFYLLADHNFKNSNFDSAAENYVMDLTFNPRRLDSLVALALSRASLVEEKVCRNRTQELDEILNDSYKVLNTFREALNVDDTNATIYIESANFAYVMCSYCSRLFKSDTSNLSMESFDKVEKRGKLFVAFARKCYEKALELLKSDGDEDSVDETWLVRFMMGKLSEKVSHSNIDASLAQYLNSIKNLKSQGAAVPRKIGFGPGTPDLSLELLEVYYRFHTSILKLELRSDVKLEEPILKQLALRMTEIRKIDVFSFEDNSHKKGVEIPAEWDVISKECLIALETTKTIFAHHYKALHQLASHYLRKKEWSKARKYLLGVENANSSSKEPSLFAERKANNLFNGIWRMPVNEFERAGSFPAHVGKCLTALFEYFRETDDHNGFAEAAGLLRKAPDGDRKYLFEEERKTFHVEACSSLMIILQKKTADFTAKTADSPTKEEKPENNEGKQDEDSSAEKETKSQQEKVRFLMDLAQILNKLKKFYPKCDQIKEMVKRIFCDIASRGARDCTFDEINTFVLRLNQADKAQPVRSMAADKFKALLQEALPKPRSNALMASPPKQGSPNASRPGPSSSVASTSKASAATAAAAAANANLINNMWLAAAAAAASNQIAMFNAASTIAQQAMASFSQQQQQQQRQHQKSKQQQQQQQKSTKIQSRPAIASSSSGKPKEKWTSQNVGKQVTAPSTSRPSPAHQAQQQPGPSSSSQKPVPLVKASKPAATSQQQQRQQLTKPPATLQQQQQRQLQQQQSAKAAASLLQQQSAQKPAASAASKANFPKQAPKPSTSSQQHQQQPRKRPHPSSSAAEKLKLFTEAVGKSLLQTGDSSGNSSGVKRAKKDGSKSNSPAATPKGNNDDDDIICLD